MAAEIIEEIEELCQMKHSVMQFFFVQNKKRLLEKFPLFPFFLKSREKNLLSGAYLRNTSASIFLEG